MPSPLLAVRLRTAPALALLLAGILAPCVVAAPPIIIYRPIVPPPSPIIVQRPFNPNPAGSFNPTPGGSFNPNPGAEHAAADHAVQSDDGEGLDL